MKISYFQLSYPSFRVGCLTYSHVTVRSMFLCGCLGLTSSSFRVTRSLNWQPHMHYGFCECTCATHFHLDGYLASFRLEEQRTACFRCACFTLTISISYSAWSLGSAHSTTQSLTSMTHLLAMHNKASHMISRFTLHAQWESR